MAPVAPLMPDARPSIERIGHDGAAWLRAEAALLRHEVKASTLRWLGVAALCLSAHALLLIGLLLASQAAIIGLTPVTQSTIAATAAVAIGATALAVLAAVTAIYLVRSGSLLDRLEGRLSAVWTMATRSRR